VWRTRPPNSRGPDCGNFGRRRSCASPPSCPRGKTAAVGEALRKRKEERVVSKYLIYGLTDPRTGEVRYIGKSTSGFTRPKSHAFACHIQRAYTYKANWVRGLIDVGLRYGIRILEEFDNTYVLPEAECYWIAQARGLGWELTNATSGGDGLNGYSHTATTLAKMSAAATGRRFTEEHRRNLSVAHLGHGHTVETRAKMSATRTGKVESMETRMRKSIASMGRVVSPKSVAKRAATMAERQHTVTSQTRAKMSAAHKGRTHVVTPEARAKMSAAAKGRHHTQETRAKISAAVKRRTASGDR
jgi:hypothetical protein